MKGVTALEYRVVELELDGKVIRSGNFDFGCSAVVQDRLKAFESEGIGVADPAKFALNLVESVLYRMLDGKITDFSLVKDIAPETVSFLFFLFQKWYKEDMDYLGTLMDSVKVEGVKIGDASSSEGSDSLYYIIYTLFKYHNLPPRETKCWSFEEVAEILYFSERDRIAEYFKENGNAF